MPEGITCRKIEGVSILDLDGPLTAELGIQLTHNLRRLLEAGNRRFVLDLSKVDHIDSMGLGHLIGALTAAFRRAGILTLVGLTGRVEKVLATTGLLQVFVIFDCTDTALDVVKQWTFKDFVRTARGMWRKNT